MSDELENLLNRVPDRVPPAPPDVSARVRERVLRAFRPRRPRSRRRALLVAAGLSLVAAASFAAGRWASPTHAASDLTIGVRPDTVDTQHQTPVTLFGTIPSNRPGESVQIEANECGQSGLFHELAGARTEGQGLWSIPIPGNPPLAQVTAYIDTKTLYRARWNGRYSETVTVYARPYLEIRQLSAPKKQKKAGKRFFGISVGGRALKRTVRVLVERRVGPSNWKTVRKVVISGGLVFTWVPAAKGQVMRARLPETEAAPCYIGTATPPTKPVR
jgi:hypothetical protein